MLLLRRLSGKRLGAAAKAAADAAEAGAATIHVPSVVFAEVLYLSEKGRTAVTLLQVAQYLAQHPSFQEYPLSLSVCQVATQIADIRELHDRLIAATARQLQLPLITNDQIIRASTAVTTIW